jgi:hypothetical protein
MRRSGGGMLIARKKEEVLSGQMTGTYDAARRRYLHNHLRQAGCGYEDLAADTRPGQALITSTKGSHATPESGSKTRSR